MKNNSLHTGAMSAWSIVACICALVLGGCGDVGSIRHAGQAEVATVAPDPWLANLVGRWDIERTIRGTKEGNKLEVRWVLGRRFVEMHMIDVARPPKYEAIVLVGRDASKDRYVAYWTDVFGAQYSGVGYGKRVGDSVDFVFDSPDGSRFHNTFTWSAHDGAWRSLMESESAAGARAFFAEDRYRRAAQP